jgi:hypothetical protein
MQVTRNGYGTEGDRVSSNLTEGTTHLTRNTAASGGFSSSFRRGFAVVSTR